MDPLERRVERLETSVDSIRSESKADRHSTRNENTVKFNKIYTRLSILEKAVAAFGPDAENRWLKWALGIAIASLAGAIGLIVRGQ